MKIIGREQEQKKLREYLDSERPEFVAVYGRRRIGKTYLINEFFGNTFTFKVSGLSNASMQMQLSNFTAALNEYGQVKYPNSNNWFDQFDNLRHLIINSRGKGKKVIFIDELPWFDTHKSHFISAIEHFWNNWASTYPDILLICCGSATSWMINKLINNRGGLYNRVTRRMKLEAFTLKECEEYYNANHIAFNRYSMIECYMILGGVPYYLNLLDKNLSLAQNIDVLCFSANGPLNNEFSALYASLFKHSDNYVSVIKAICRKSKGITREEIVKTSKIPSSGSLTKILLELEECGFIRKYHPFNNKNKCHLYQMVDFFSLFHINYIEDNKTGDECFWSHIIDNAQHRAWSGYSFELVCLLHINQIKKALGISGVTTRVASWKSKEREETNGAQIDLVIDRNDQTVNLCEMKFLQKEFSIDKHYESILRNKKGTFIDETKTKKAVHLTLVTTYGLAKNQYSSIVQQIITMDELFE